MPSSIQDNNEMMTKITDLFAGLQDELEKNRRQMEALWQVVAENRADAEPETAADKRTEQTQEATSSDGVSEATEPPTDEVTKGESQEESPIDALPDSHMPNDDDEEEIGSTIIGDELENWQALLAIAGVGAAGYLTYRLWRRA